MKLDQQQNQKQASIQLHSIESHIIRSMKMHMLGIIAQNYKQYKSQRKHHSLQRTKKQTETKKSATTKY